MTSQKSLNDERKAKQFRHAFLTGLKSSSVTPAIVNLVIFTVVTIVVSAITLFKTETTEDAAGNIVIKSVSEGFRYLLITESGIYSILLLVSVMIASLAAAMLSFRFITSKKTVNVYYSLGVSRDKLYLARYLSGLLPIFLSVIIPFVAAFIINLITIGYSTSLLAATAFYITSFCASAMIVYSVTAAAFSAVGTFFEAGIFSIIILMFPTILLNCLQVLMKNFLLGSPYGKAFPFFNTVISAYDSTTQKLTSRYEFLSPIMFDKTTLSNWGALDTAGTKNPLSDISAMLGGEATLSWYPSMLYALAWILVSIAVLFIGMYVFQKRKAERCGFIGMCKPLNAFSGFTVGFFALCMAIYCLPQIPISTTISILIGFCLFIVCYVVIDIVLLRDLKGFVRGLVKLPVELAVAGIIIAIFATGLFGYSSTIPSVTDISKVAVTVVGSCTEYGLYSNNSWATMSSSDDFTYPGGTSLLDGFTSENDIKKIISLHSSMINLGKVEPTNIQDTSVKEDDRILAARLQFAYTMKDGSVILRNYDAATPSIIKDFLSLEDCDLFKERLKTVFADKIEASSTKIGSYEADDKYLTEYTQNAVRGKTSTISMYSRYADTTIEFELSLAQRAELARCIYADLQNRTAQEKYFPEKTPVGILSFATRDYFTGGGDTDNSIPVTDVFPEESTDEGMIDESMTGDEFTSESELSTDEVSLPEEPEDGNDTTEDLAAVYSRIYEQLHGTTQPNEEDNTTEVVPATQAPTTEPVTEPTTESTTALEIITKAPVTTTTAPNPEGVAYTPGSRLIASLSAIPSTTKPESTTSPSENISTTGSGSATNPSDGGTTTSDSASTTAPDTSDDKTIGSVVPGEEGPIGIPINNVATKFAVEHSNSFLISGRFSYDVAVTVTEDMENTIAFLKKIGVFDTLVAKPDFTTAEIMTVEGYNAVHYYFNTANGTRYFTGSCTQRASAETTDMYFFSDFDNDPRYTTSLANDVSSMLKVGSLAYYNNTDTGYYVRFITRNKQLRTTFFVPYDKMPASIAKSVQAFEETNPVGNKIFGLD